MTMQHFELIYAGITPRAYGIIRFAYESTRNWIPFTAWAEVWDGKQWYIMAEPQQFVGGRIHDLLLPGKNSKFILQNIF